VAPAVYLFMCFDFCRVTQSKKAKEGDAQLPYVKFSMEIANAVDSRRTHNLFSIGRRQDSYFSCLLIFFNSSSISFFQNKRNRTRKTKQNKNKTKKIK